MTVNNNGLGLWFVGGRGSVATTATIGAAAVASHAAHPIGMVTEHPALEGVELPAIGELVVGGHDLVTTPLRKRAEQLADDGVVPSSLLESVADRLDRAEEEMRHAPDRSVTPVNAVERVRADLRDFKERHGLEHVVVVNLASTEPPPTWADAPTDPDQLDALLDAGWADCPVSITYAMAAISAGCAYVDFTPAAASATPAIAELARRAGIPIAGRDGKTGETLLKTVLAPMFSDRALKVLSWAGTNLLGGGDGATLADPRYASSKLESKARVLGQVLNDEVVAPVHIDHVPDLGEWKTAWNHIHFEGFLGTRMQLQFTWQGCDSSLAAPLVLDLARLTALAMSRGESGPIDVLGFFFKDPISGSEHRLAQQFDALQAWAAGT